MDWSGLESSQCMAVSFLSWGDRFSPWGHSMAARQVQTWHPQVQDQLTVLTGVCVCLCVHPPILRCITVGLEVRQWVLQLSSSMLAVSLSFDFPHKSWGQLVNIYKIAVWILIRIILNLQIKLGRMHNLIILNLLIQGNSIIPFI